MENSDLMLIQRMIQNQILRHYGTMQYGHQAGTVLRAIGKGGLLSTIAGTARH